MGRTGRSITLGVPPKRMGPLDFGRSGQVPLSPRGPELEKKVPQGPAEGPGLMWHIHNVYPALRIMVIVHKIGRACARDRAEKTDSEIWDIKLLGQPGGGPFDHPPHPL